MIRFFTMLAATALVSVSLGCADRRGDGPMTGADPRHDQAGQPSMSPEAHTDPAIRRLEQDAMALARTSGCTSANQCRTAAVGSRPCGGPRYYLPYCRLTTDSAALFAKLEEVKRAEEDYNRRNQLGSTCEFRMPPDVEVVDGVCRAKTVR